MGERRTDGLVELFQWFHSHPELAYQEHKTTEKIRAVLEADGIEVLDLPLETGLVAQIVGNLPGPIHALRADIDALPIEEEAPVAYRSLHPGVMHACGHDFHTTALLGAARLLQGRKADLAGTVKLIFQPAEEAPSGALKILESGAVDDVERFWALHTLPGLPVGSLGIRQGPVMAAVDRFTVTIQGKGTHAAHPQDGVDAVVTASALVQALQTIVSRNLDPFTAGLVSVTHLQAGNTWNVLPDTAFLEGTVRTMAPRDRELIRHRLEQVVTLTAQAYGATAALGWFPGPPSVINDGPLCDLAAEVAADQGLAVIENDKSLGGEDFSLYLTDRPGVFIRVGTGGQYPLHHPRFTADPAALGPASEFLVHLALKSLKR